MFDKNPDGRMRVRHGGGTCRKRMHSAGDMTGSEIMRVLRDETRSHEEDIEVIEFLAAVELLKDSHGRVNGALMYNMETEEYSVIMAKAVVMATGGFGRLHVQGFATTNHYGATADGLVMGYRAGVPLDFTPLVSMGLAGVTIFFVLSGFLLAIPFAEWQSGLRQRPALDRYFLRRVMRVFPASTSRASIN